MLQRVTIERMGIENFLPIGEGQFAGVLVGTLPELLAVLPDEALRTQLTSRANGWPRGSSDAGGWSQLFYFEGAFPQPRSIYLSQWRGGYHNVLAVWCLAIDDRSTLAELLQGVPLMGDQPPETLVPWPEVEEER